MICIFIFIILFIYLVVVSSLVVAGECDDDEMV